MTENLLILVKLALGNIFRHSQDLVAHSCFTRSLDWTSLFFAEVSSEHHQATPKNSRSLRDFPGSFVSYWLRHYWPPDRSYRSEFGSDPRKSTRRAATTRWSLDSALRCRNNWRCFECASTSFNCRDHGRRGTLQYQRRLHMSVRLFTGLPDSDRRRSRSR